MTSKILVVLLAVHSFVTVRCSYVTGGLLCFNVHDDELPRYEDKIRELEIAKTWKLIAKERIPYMDHAAFPRESNAFVYQVVKG